MNINLHFTSFFIPKAYIKIVLGIIESIGVIIPIVFALLLIVNFFSTKSNINYYDKHLDQEHSQEKLDKEKENLQGYLQKLKKYILISIICILVVIALEAVKKYVKF